MPTFWNGGDWTCWISDARSRSAPRFPGGREERRQQRVLAAARRGSTPASDSTLVAVALARSRELRVAAGRRRRRGKRAEDRQRQAGAAARRVDGEVGRGAKPLDPGAVLPPLGQASFQLRRLLRGVGVRRLAGAAGLVLVDPRTEVFRRQAAET